MKQAIRALVVRLFGPKPQRGASISERLRWIRRYCLFTLPGVVVVAGAVAILVRQRWVGIIMGVVIVLLWVSQIAFLSWAIRNARPAARLESWLQTARDPGAQGDRKLVKTLVQLICSVLFAGSPVIVSDFINHGAQAGLVTLAILVAIAVSVGSVVFVIAAVVVRRRS